jgi:23S rRNA (adenine1618-N6)-methyltransferase
MDSTRKDFHRGYDPARSVTGIDIGIGSSCIYPLLGCVARPNWNFIGTDIDEKNYNHAVYNATNNDLDKRIRLVKTSHEDPFFSRAMDHLKINQADFTMCNPPFFDSKQEMMSTFDKDNGPSAICTGAEVEMVTNGGEAAYVSRMVDESKALGEKVQWYTSQLGKAASLPIVIDKLRALECSNWAVGVLNPHERTRRWVIGWSWGDLRPKNVSSFSIDISDPK